MDKKQIEEKISEIIKEHSQFNKDKISLEMDLRDNFGIDSITLVEMLVEIEGAFGIAIDSSLLTYDSFSTGNMISQYVFNTINS